MLDKEDLQAIAQLLKPINDRLDSMDERLSNVENQLADIKEDTETTRGAVNTLLDWADDASIQVVPLFHKRKPE